MDTRARRILLITGIACLLMGVVDSVIQPGYAARSAIKAALFLLLPLLGAGRTLRQPLCASRRALAAAAAVGLAVFALLLGGFFLLRPVLDLSQLTGTLTASTGVDRQNFPLVALYISGLAVFALLLGGFFLLRPVLDLSQLTGTLTASTGVDRQNFPLVALYISLVNSFLEESFFRGFAFLALASHTSARTACLFSAGAFALYHVAMTLGWFPLPLLMLVVAGLFLGGCFFNWCAWKSGSLLPSWLIHISADLAICAIGMILFQEGAVI